MKFSFNLNRVIQVLSVASALGTQYSPVFGNQKTRDIITSSAVIASAVAGLLAHFKNPDGSPVSEAYKPKPKVDSLGKDFKEQ